MIKYLELLKIKPNGHLNIGGKYVDYFCVVDSYALDMYWYKYERNVEYRFTRSYPEKNPRAIEFSDWLQLSQIKILTGKKITIRRSGLIMVIN